ncbi:reverse transcriptase domain-containing protein, partial [Tanacetum coccineum]
MSGSRRVRYPSWVSNPVLVKKVDGSWRMCIDFKDLNKACPKDLYPLPEIDWKIESLMGFKYKCFLDAYKGYHQIQMTKKDEEKTAFHTEEGVFCYMKMPFGLKNVGATYQRLVDSAFKEQIGVNLEAYVDDMVIKSRTEQDIIKDIEQTFSTLRRINIKLNPKKCSFGAETNYALMEKLTLALVHAARRLRRYFQAHPIKVITDSPIKQVLSNSEASGRLAKWVVELGAYGIQYVPRVAVKGQVLVDFLADTSTEINVAPVVASTQRVEDIPESSNAMENLTPGPRAWRLYTDGASNNGGSGAGLILIAPDDVEYSYALRLNFSNSNNEAEYEALLAGLRIATEMQVKDIHAFEKVLELVGAFNRFRITRIPRAKNRKADALSKLAAIQFDHLSKEVLVEVLNGHSIEAQEVGMVVEEEGPTWMTPIRNYIEKGMLPEDPVNARTLMEKIGNYTMEDRVLYRKSYLVLLMRCVGPLQANYVIREVHMGLCGMHDGPRHVVAKAMNLGYWWPSMHRDARELIRACDDCQAHASVPRLLKADMISVTLAWPFMKWGMDIVGPLSEGPGRGNGAVEKANRSLLRGIKTRLEKGGPTWAEEELRLNLDLLEEQKEIAAIREA